MVHQFRMLRGGTRLSCVAPRMAAMRSFGKPTCRHHLCCSAKERTRAVARETSHMDRGLFFVIGDFFNTFGSAAAGARAVEAGRKPRRSDLKKLGIDPAAFDRSGRI
ncbi:hypothetical protein [Mesorhizobium sp. B2-7-1]|uniref:hypothetical protein n=1 Tax=Mesorhizobium sp. B2-7-1 TaxID=2589909 RepID=UPI00112CCD61|nr:hypothetical protein [Mesorhizobium sp. B2-7-1]TPJ59257.1 hypothetical protein FJ471_19845 [Mesorhizobium sp. B2-7-1]